MQKLAYKGIGDAPSICGYDVVRCGQLNVIVVTELTENLGTTVANATELLVDQIVTQLGLDLSTVVWIVHFPDGLLEGEEETYTLAVSRQTTGDTLNWGELAWRTLTADEAMEFILGDNPLLGEEIRLLPPQ